MILIIGGAASGKLNYVRSLGYESGAIANGVLDDRPVVNNLQEMITGNAAVDDSLFQPLLLKAVVICQETGSGVIPAERAEREWRDAVGRMCVRLAANADTVVRMVSGIPVVIKGTIGKGASN